MSFVQMGKFDDHGDKMWEASLVMIIVIGYVMWSKMFTLLQIIKVYNVYFTRLMIIPICILQTPLKLVINVLMFVVIKESSLN